MEATRHSKTSILLASIYLILLVLEVVFINQCFGSFCVKDDWLLYLNPGVFIVALGSMGDADPSTASLVIVGLITAGIISTTLFFIGSVLERVLGNCQ